MAKKVLIDNYCLTELIGKGSYGEVYYTKKYNEPNNIYATKKMKKEKVEAQDYWKYFTNEINILRGIDHKNIIKIKDLKKTTHHYYIVMEYCNGGTLKENFRKYKNKYGKPFSEKIIQHIIRQIVEAVNYLHSKNIVHRDLKADNMLLNYYTKEAQDNLDILNSDLKIIDFGTSTYKSKISKNETEKMLQTVVGSPLTMDPVILKMYIGESNGVIPYNEKIDIWSLGILCYYLFTGNFPFIEAKLNDLLKAIEKGDIILPSNISVEAISFLIKMLEYSPDKRASA
jgi:serine/threonine protein kinase